MPEVWPLIRAEREAVADEIAPLTPEQLATESLCSGWTVRDAAGHMIATAGITPGSFFANLIGSGFRFNTMSERLLARSNQGDAAQLAGRLREKAGGPNHPPGPVTAMLGEAIVHGEDIRRPLGIKRDVPEASLVAVADFYKKSNLLLGSKRRIAGLRLRATDAGWTHGEGPEVAGPLASLLLAMTGRKAAVEDLSGEGVATLRGRM